MTGLECYKHRYHKAFIFVNDFPHFIVLNFHQPDSTMDEMNIQNPEPNNGHF